MKKIMILVVILLFTNINVYGEELYLSGKGYILMEASSGRVLAEKNADVKMGMASTTKIMTALLGIEEGNLEDMVEIHGPSINVEGSSIYLKDGELISLKDLLYGLMLRSGNDSALAIANYISGSEENFVSLMNERAKKIGALNTNFVNPHGLSNNNHYSTAYDLALITREAFKNKEFVDMSAAKTYRGTREDGTNYFVNKNKTLWEYEGGDGVKIGYTMATGRCLVSSASRGNMRLIAVALNASDWFNDNYKLFDYGFDNYNLYTIYSMDQFITQANVKNGIKERVPLVSEKDFSYPLTDEELSNIKLTVNYNKELKAPIYKGQELGSLEVYLNGQIIKKDKLIAKYDVEEKPMLTRFLDFILKKTN